MSEKFNCPNCETPLTCDDTPSYGFYGENMFCSECLYTGSESVFKEATHEIREEEKQDELRS